MEEQGGFSKEALILTKRIKKQYLEILTQLRLQLEQHSIDILTYRRKLYLLQKRINEELNYINNCFPNDNDKVLKVYLHIKNKLL